MTLTMLHSNQWREHLILPSSMILKLFAGMETSEQNPNMSTDSAYCPTIIPLVATVSQHWSCWRGSWHLQISEYLGIGILKFSLTLLLDTLAHSPTPTLPFLTPPKGPHVSFSGPHSAHYSPPHLFPIRFFLGQR